MTGSSEGFSIFQDLSISTPGACFFRTFQAPLHFPIIIYFSCSPYCDDLQSETPVSRIHCRFNGIFVKENQKRKWHVTECTQ